MDSRFNLLSYIFCLLLVNVFLYESIHHHRYTYHYTLQGHFLTYPDSYSDTVCLYTDTQKAASPQICNLLRMYLPGLVVQVSSVPFFNLSCRLILSCPISQQITPAAGLWSARDNLPAVCMSKPQIHQPLQWPYRRMRNQSVRAFVRVLALLSLLGTTLGVLAKRGYGVVAELKKFTKAFGELAQ